MLNKLIKSSKNKTFVTKISTIIMIMFFICLNFYPNTTFAQYVYTPINLTTTNATNITGNSVILNALINGNNLYSTYNTITWFEYGPSTSLSYVTTHVGPNVGYASFSVNVANLSPNTIYYFRAIAQTSQGIVYGEINSFKTSYANLVINGTNNNTSSVLTTITNPANAISDTTVELNSIIINQNNDSSNTWFEYGETADLGNTTPMVSTGTLDYVKHINTLTKLSPNTTYYYRSVAQNSSTKVNGSILSFTTTKTSSTTNNKYTNINTTTKTDSITKVDPSLIKISSTGIASYLGANVISSGSFFPGNILGWMIILILILLLIMLIRHPNTGLVKNNHTETTHH